MKVNYSFIYVKKKDNDKVTEPLTSLQASIAIEAQCD